MLEALNFDYSPFPSIQKWIARMREFPYIEKANEAFYANREGLKALRKKPEPKL